MAPVFAILLASLRPLGFDEMLRVLNASNEEAIGEETLRQRFSFPPS